MNSKICVLTTAILAAMLCLSCGRGELPPDAKGWLAKYEELGKESIDFAKTNSEFKERAEALNRSNPGDISAYEKERVALKKKQEKHNTATEQHLSAVDDVVKKLNSSQAKRFYSEVRRIKGLIEKGKAQYK